MNKELRKVVSVAEAGEMLGLGQSLTYAAIHRGEIPSIRIGGRILIPLAALEKMLSKATTDEASAPVIKPSNASKEHEIVSEPVEVAFLIVLNNLVSAPVVQLSNAKVTSELTIYLNDNTITSYKVGRLMKKFFGSVGSRSGSKGSYRYRLTRKAVVEAMLQIFAD